MQRNLSIEPSTLRGFVLPKGSNIIHGLYFNRTISKPNNSLT